MNFVPAEHDGTASGVIASIGSTVLDAYVRSLSAPIDSYLERLIVSSDLYRISAGGRAVGSFAIRDGSLTQFHLVGAARRYGQQTLARILDEHDVSEAIVPTSDNFMLAHVLDRKHVLHLGGYFFAEAEPGRPTDATDPEAPWPEGGYRRARATDVAAVEAVSGDFLDPLAEHVAAGEVHVGFAGGELVAVGIAESGRLLSGYASIGMFTAETHRHRGIGTATLRYLRSVCHADGITPIAGCAYHNTASKRTLEAAGMVTATRLLRIEFRGTDSTLTGGGTEFSGTEHGDAVTAAGR